MSSVNKVILVGHVGRDPESRTFPSGDRICNVTLATSEKWKDKQSGEAKEATEWHRLVFNGRIAEIAGEYIRKGSLIYIEGSIKSRKYTDKEGVEKITTEIRVAQLQLLGGRQDGGSGGGSAPARAPAAQRPAAKPSGGGGGDMDDDIPFIQHERRLIC